MTVRLVEASADDEAWLDALRRAAYADLFDATWGAWDEARHRRHFAASWGRGGIDLIEVNGERVGMLQRSEDDAEVRVEEIQILPVHQGLGTGSHVLTELIAAAHASGKAVSLATGLKNHRAHALYTRLGFRETTRSDTHFHMTCPPP